LTSARDGDEEIYVMDADGSRPRNLARHRGRDTDPAWHPDGRRIAFVSDRAGQSEFYLMDVELSRSAGSDPTPADRTQSGRKTRPTRVRPPDVDISL
jgi:Tol biopolymer transport system component